MDVSKEQDSKASCDETVLGRSTNPNAYEIDLNAVKSIFEFHQKMYWELVSLIAKGVAFYLAVNAALIGYVVGTKLPVYVKQQIAFLGIGISVLFFVAAGCGVWVLYINISHLEHSAKRLGEREFNALAMGGLFGRLRLGTRIVAVCTALGVALITMGLFLLRMVEI